MNAPSDDQKQGAARSSFVAGRDDWMHTYSGKKVFIGAPTPQDIEFEDIAHHLSMICRFGGASRRFYSVAEHSVLVSHLVPRHCALEALFHDASEAFLQDLPRPVKWLCSDYRKLEALWNDALSIRLDLPLNNLSAEVKEADTMALYHEAVDLLTAHHRADWHIIVPKQMREDLRHIGAPEVQGLDPHTAKQAFIDRCIELTSKGKRRRG